MKKLLPFLMVLLLGFGLIWVVSSIKLDKTCDDLTLSDDHVRCLGYEAFTFYQQKNMSEALKALSRARQADTHNPLFALYECQWRAQAEQHELAISACEAAIAYSNDKSITTAAYQQLSGSAGIVGHKEEKNKACSVLMEQFPAQPEERPFCP